MSSAVIVGATSGVGRALAEDFAKAGFHLLLVARDREDLEATACNIRLRFGTRCHVLAQDIGDPSWDVAAFARDCSEKLDGVDCLLVPAGGVTSADVGATEEVLSQLTAVNYLGPARLAAAFGTLMSQLGRGSVVLFSSIAAAAPRTRNAAYSAAKAALETYARALRHALEPKGVRISWIRLGYVDTPQSFGMKLALPVARPEDVARFVRARIRAGSGPYHYPFFWRAVTLVLRVLPWALYRRLSF
ncbi:MAG TPA: SDR family NAD(P)-dependent oxidoreductase [Polyangiaceae bacterium]|nr:SDR family NAD(P)-dependent oxidoreductase [Polyangiaceae bacterium]